MSGDQSIKKEIHQIEVPVRWCDMDAFGHVNNSIYFSYFELARISWWDKIMPEGSSFLEIGPVVINAYCTFYKAIHYPETLLVKLLVGPAGRSSHECYYEIYSKENPEIKYADGSTKVVWVDRKNAHSVPLPECLVKHLPGKKHE